MASGEEFGVKLRLYASECPRNDFYLDRVEQLAGELGLICTVEKVMDEADIAAQGFDSVCQPSYCPGCRANHMSLDDPNGLYLPVLAGNGKPLFWNVPPSDEALRAALEEFL
ncbi:hypothetical protein [Oscillibacter sp.]|uniref:hypothetical protein n=1 Tax=Oscillibacter sp. TaxID=1945593 RepID=UPI0028AD811F|nr:hypothetical protein [Oscillibacter sp.]